MTEKKLLKWTLAFSIALLPPIWAVLAPHLGIQTGAVALICAGLYVANGNQRKNAFRIAAGFLAGDLWAILAIWLMELLPIPQDVELFLTLFLMGGAAVLIGETFSTWILTPAWLCGWAIGLTIMGSVPVSELGTLPLQIAAAMLVGVLYVGIGVDAFQHFLIRKIRQKPEKTA